MELRDISLYTDEELALCVWAGFLGYGVTRKTKLGSRYTAVQALVDKQSKTKVIEPGAKHDTESLKKAVKSLYSKAADEVIALIEKEAK